MDAGDEKSLKNNALHCLSQSNGGNNSFSLRFTMMQIRKAEIKKKPLKTTTAFYFVYFRRNGKSGIDREKETEGGGGWRERGDGDRKRER